MIAPQQHSIQDSAPDDLLAKLRKRLDHRWREVTEESAIALALALERGYYLEKTKRGLERLGFKRSQQRVPALGVDSELDITSSGASATVIVHLEQLRAALHDVEEGRLTADAAKERLRAGVVV